MRSFPQRGVSLVDVLIGSALVLIIFLGLFAIVRASLAVSSLSKLKNTATAIATTQLEYIRSLSYGSVGTVGGIPSGIIAQYATSTEEGVAYVTRTFIEYADDPADGEDVDDENGIITDYKHVKVTTTYTANDRTRVVALVSNFSPPGIETTTGGGTLRISVVDAAGLPVSGASVRIVNDETSPTVDLTTFSSANGLVYLPGAATSTEYQVYVEKDGYSSAQTHERDAVNVNPTPGYLTVVEDTTTESTFAIDVLATLLVRTFSPVAPEVYEDLFTDSSGLFSSANTSVSGGALTLSGAPGSYAPSGSATSIALTPENLISWTNASSTVSVPGSTGVVFYIEDGAGSLIPDAAIPGNASGLSGVIDLSSVSTTTYPTLSIRAELSSSDANVTSSVEDWGIGYEAGPTPLPNVDFTLSGAKTIGSTALGDPLYKTEIATTTNAEGERELTLEWDLYTLLVSGYTISSSDPESPVEVLPAGDMEMEIILTP